MRSLGQELMATGARTEQVQLGFLDPILGLAALAVQVVVQIIGWLVEIGNDEAGIGALGTKLQPGDQAPLAIPTLGRVGELPDQPLLGPGLLVGLFHRLLPVGHMAVQAGIPCHPD